MTIHRCNLQLLMIEIFKTKNSLNPTFMKDIFAEKSSYCLPAKSTYFATAESNNNNIRHRKHSV